MHSLLNRVNKIRLAAIFCIFLPSFMLMATSFQLDNFNPSAQTIDVLYDFDEGDVAGFQFSVDGLTLSGASSGDDAEAAGFEVSSGSSIVLGFSFSGTAIPSGSGLLTTLSFSDITGDEACLSDIIATAPGGTTEYASDGGTCVSTLTASLSLGSFDPSGSLEVLYDFGGPVAGFQFDVTGLALTGGSGGAAGDAGFTVQAGGSVVLGFSFTGGSIEAGSGTLTVLSFNDVTGATTDLSLGFGGAVTDASGNVYATSASGSEDHGVPDCAGTYYGDAGNGDIFGICEGNGTIQGAIDAASVGDIIDVPSGNYLESLDVNKSVSLNCEASCVIDARGISGSAVVIDATGATLDGFTIVGDETMYAGVVVSPTCTSVTVSNNTISGMALSNPGNDSPLSYGILAYGNSSSEMPVGSTFSGNEISYVAGAAISLGSYTYATTITGNHLHDIIPVEFLGEQLSVGVQSEFAGALNVSENTFGNLYIGTSLLASEGSVSGNTYNNVASLHTSTYPSSVLFGEEIAWWQIFSTVNYLGQDILLISYASTLEYAIFAADDGSIITASDGTEVVQDCSGDWGGDAVVDECGDCGGDGIAEGACDCDGNVLDCADECGGSTMEDECGVCDGSGIADGACDCAGNVLDCANECGGSAVEDECGDCNGSGPEEGEDCAGNCIDSDVCGFATLSFGSVTDQTAEVLYSSNFDIGGFQFDTDGVTLTGVDSDLGDATFSSATGIVIGFSFTGGSLPASDEGVLAVLSFAPTNDSVSLSASSVTVSSSTGLSLASSGPTSVETDGCYVVDCAGACYGDLVEDECGECGGDGIDEGACDCAGNVLDCAGECGGTTVEDCAGECGGDTVVDDCGECGGNSECLNASLILGDFDPSGTLEILYDFGGPVAGFQFDVTGLALTDGSGGAAGDAGFTVSTGGSTVLGFSFTGSSIAAGSGTLTVLAFSDVTAGTTELSLGNFGAVTDASGNTYTTSASGSEDHGDPDCSGDYYGDLVVDECGECGGDGPDEGFDCNGNSLQTTLTIDLTSGWSWFSMNVVPEDASIEAIIPNETGAVQTIKGQNNYTQYYSEWEAWYPAFEFDVTKTYVVDSNTESSISITGDEVDVANTPIDLASGWNWIGYLPQVEWDVDTALASVDFSHGDILKTQNSFTNYYLGYGWYPGHVEGFVLKPAGGLQLKVFGTSTLIYPSGTPFLGMISGDSFETLDELNANNPSLWNVDYHNFEFNSTITSKVIIDGIVVGSDDDMLGVFVNGECRGLARAVKTPFSDDYVFLLMAYSNNPNGEEMSLSYYDATNNVVYNDIQKLQFEVDMVRGDAIESFMVVYNENNDIIVPDAYNLGAAYPNPFNPTTNIEYSIIEGGYTNIVVYSLQGQIVAELVNDYKDIGNYKVQWNAVNVSSGIYFIHMNVNGFTSNQKVMLIK